MVPTYSVHAIRLGTIYADKSALVHGFAPGTLLEIPIWAAAVEGNGRRLLVDTGINDASKWSLHDKHTQRPHETIDAALAELGWQIADVDVVINSHLHYDHSENNLRFGHAQFFVSRAEWEFAADPSSAQKFIYDLEWIGPDLHYMNYTLIDADDYDVMPGVRVIQTPGHTPGHQSVLISTPEGTLCVAGDAACLMENLTGPTPPGTFVSGSRAVTSIRKICGLSDRILMNHDLSLSSYQDSGFPECPALD